MRLLWDGLNEEISGCNKKTLWVFIGFFVIPRGAKLLTTNATKNRRI
jgi:hypothetical protein